MKERIYIIPTRYGFLYGMGIFITVSAGVIYSNNLVYLLSFFLVSLILIGMIQTHNNLKSIKVEKMSVELCPEFSSTQGKVWVKSENSDSHNQIEIRPQIKKAKNFHFTIETLSRKSLKIQTFSFQGLGRGKYEVGKVKLSTTFPFGLFYAWKIQTIKDLYYVYPQPISHSSSEYSFKLGDSFEKRNGTKGEDYTQHNKYKIGDSPKHIDWKALAKGRGLLTKEFKDGDRQSIIIDFDKIPGGIKEKLEQISFWILDCEKTQKYYSIKLKDRVLGPAIGINHKNKCLQALAEFEVKDVA
jgi:uncharacterized protein (DUF58 family)